MSGHVRKLRQTDFLPVGEGTESEVLERGVLSETTDSDEDGMEFAAAGSDPHFSVEDVVFSHDPDFDE